MSKAEEKKIYNCKVGQGHESDKRLIKELVKLAKNYLKFGEETWPAFNIYLIYIFFLFRGVSLC